MLFDVVPGRNDITANTAQCAYIADLLAKMCADIEKNDIAKKYDMVYNQYKKVWQDTYLSMEQSEVLELERV